MIRRLLNIRRGEGSTVLVLLTFVFFIQSVLSTGKVLQISVFLDTYGQQSLALAFFLSAATVIVVSAGYSALTRLVRTATLIPAMLLVLASGFVIWRCVFGDTRVDFPLGLLNAPSGIEDPYGPFVLYIWVEVASSIAIVQAWAYTNDAFDPRQAKRLIPLVGLGASFSFLCNGLIVQPLVVHWIDVSDLTWAVAGSLLLSLLVFHFAQRRSIGSAHSAGAGAEAEAGVETEAATADELRTPGFFATLQKGFPQIARSPLLRLVVFVTIATVIAQGLLDYLFMNALRERMTRNELAAFYATFIGLLGAIQIILQLFVSGRLLVRFGGPIIVVLTPALVVLGGAAFLMLPLFWLLVGLRFGDRLFKQAFYSPSLQALYTPIPSREKHQAMTLIKGVISPAAYMLLGLLLLVGGAQLSARTLVAVLVGVGLTTTVVLLIRSRSAYAVALKRIMSRRRLDFETVVGDLAESLDWETIAVVQRSVFEDQSDDRAEDRAVFGLRLVAGSTAPQVRALINRACRRHPSAVVRKEASRLIAARAWPADTSRILRLLGTESDPSVVGQHLQTLVALRGEGVRGAVVSRLGAPQVDIRAAAAVSARALQVEDQRADRVLESLATGDFAERLALARALLHSGDPALAMVCTSLLRDARREIRAVALRAAAVMCAPLLLAEVVRCFESVGPREEAAFALVAYGPSGIPALAEILGRSDASVGLRLRTIRVLGQVDAPESGALLMGLLASRTHTLRYGAGVAVASLSRRATQWPGLARPERVARILSEVRVGYLLRTLIRGAEQLESPLDPPLLLRELEFRLRACEDHIFTLLSLADGGGNSAMVLQNLRRGDSTQRTHALELLEITFSRYVAGVLVPFVLGEIHSEDIFRVMPDARERLRLAETDPVASLLRGKDHWLQLCAAYEVPERVSALAPDVSALAMDSCSVFDTVLPLRRLSMFDELSAAEIEDLCESAQVVPLSDGAVLFGAGDPCDALYVVMRGEISLRHQGRELSHRSAGDSLGEAAVSEGQHHDFDAVADPEAVVLRIDAREIAKRLPGNHRLVKGLFRRFTSRLREENPAVQCSPTSHAGPPALP
jgi:ATP:ADP antiporter, AAA family